jgi:hypothetical protein
MSQHTQEPWVFGYSNDTGPDDDYFREFFEITTLNGLVVARADKEADARLIAAAPDLLAALKDLLEVQDEPCRIDHQGYCQAHYLDDVSHRGCRVSRARAAIDRATRTQP